MKLIYCLKCGDIIKLTGNNEKSCECGSSKGKYEEDGWHAWYSGEYAVPVGIHNSQFRNALLGDSRNRGFKAWIFNRDYKRFVRKEL